METITSKKRLLALDVMRGITIAGMILVNNPGGTPYKPLEHADWIGLTPTDLVFPFFMFIMGITTYLSLSKTDFTFSGKTGWKILKRASLIWIVGLVIAWLFMFKATWEAEQNATLSFLQHFLVSCNTLDHIRLLGVLPRLGICYGLTAIIAITVNHKFLPWFIAVLFVGYFIILALGNGFVHGSENILYKVDDLIMGKAHMYTHDTPDPEGILSTIPALGHVLIGFCVGEVMMKFKNINDKIERLFLLGALLTFSGLLLSYACPISKKLWTPTFALTTCGLASTLLAILIWCIDKNKYVNTLTRFFESFGVNPLFLYVLSEILVVPISLHLHINNSITDIRGLSHDMIWQPLFGENGGSLAYSIVYILINWSIGYILYKKKIYIKL